jgi:hypothetical protein
MEKLQWSRLIRQQVGAYAEYFVKMEFTKYGFQVYTAEVDDRGIDFVARHDRGPFVQVQVKSLRSFGYVFMRKSCFPLEDCTYLALGLLFDGSEPELFLIPSLKWSSPDGTFVDRDYQGLKSEPEWGINVSKKNLADLDRYKFEATLESIVRLGASSTAWDELFLPPQAHRLMLKRRQLIEDSLRQFQPSSRNVLFKMRD